MTTVSAGATLRFDPHGGYEYVMSAKTPRVGDVLKRNGDNWIVEEVTKAEDGTSVVTLRPQPKPVRLDDDPVV